MTAPTRRSRDGLPVPVAEITALIDPRLAGALCAGEAPFFDSLIPGETEEERRNRFGRAATICAQCPVAAACERAAIEHQAHGIWAGEHRGRIERAAGTGPRVRARERAEAA